ncbi:hypothetical protein C9374_007510 [Naegleria lovaniensis]|uniref:Inosine/uridine-preferring nucleoside hydrolase domain-containing protein n=1 Tax=Naegleria lovaniensis TaxID=51637 RepID=A0AA88GN09_NAELO|nr:uncharacterized protein C9374_007510 [Naegleria lovaniensis]KAG2379371.1 hypothetical protein C9374_007510 [Naegleria lovaniensis]
MPKVKNELSRSVIEQMVLYGWLIITMMMIVASCGFNNIHASRNIPVIVDSDLGTDDLFAILHLLHHDEKQLEKTKMKFNDEKYIHCAGTNNNFTISIIGISLVTGMQLSLETSVDILQRLQLFTNGFKHMKMSMTNSIYYTPSQEMKLPKLYISMDPHGLIPSQSHSFAEGTWYAKWKDRELHMADILEIPPIANYSHPVLLPVVNSQEYVKEMMHLLKNQIDLNQPATVLAIGPLTNLARLVLSNHNNLLEKAIEKIVIMGGAIDMIDPSNAINGAEWNFFCDSTAAEIVLRAFSGRTVLFDLKVANLDAVNETNAQDIYKYATSFTIPKHSLQFVQLGLLEMSRASLTYDVVTSFYLTHPHLFTFQKICVSISSQTPTQGIIHEIDCTGKEQQDIVVNRAVAFNKIQYLEYLKELFRL